MIELSVTQYAKQLGITRQAVLLQIDEHRLPSNVKSKKIGNTWIITISETKKSKSTSNGSSKK